MRINHIFLFILISLHSISQEIRFLDINANESLSQSEVFSIFKDSQGFMWFGTVDGLNRYDGYTITVFNTMRNDSNSLSNNTIRSLAEDNKGRIWIGTDNGLCIYETLKGKISRINFPTPGFSDNLVINALLNHDHFMWVGTTTGLFRVDTNPDDIESLKSGFHQIRNYNGTTKDNEVCVDLEKSKNGGIWVANYISVSKIILDSETNKAVIISEPNIEINSHFKSITEDINGNLWLTTISDGLIRLNTKTNETDRFTYQNTQGSISSNWTSSSVSDLEGNMWFGTIDKGLNKINSKDLANKQISFTQFQNNIAEPKSIKSNLVYSLFVSPDNFLWIGFTGSGVNYLDPAQKPFNHIKIPPLGLNESPSSNYIRAVYADNNWVWIGTHGNGLFIYNIHSNTYNKLGFNTQTIFKLKEYGNEKIFVCGNGGVALVRRQNESIIQLNSFYNDVTLDIIKCSDTVYWAATLKGMIRLSISDNNLIDSKTYDVVSTPAISSNNCRVLFYNNIKKELWLGTEGGGLNLIQLNDNFFPVSVSVFKHSNDSNSLSNNYIRAINKDKNNNIWIGTYEGLNLVIRDSLSHSLSFKVFSKVEGLPNNMIQLIEEDETGNLWIGSNGGLTRFNPKLNQFDNFTVSDGLQSNEFSEHTSFKRADGKIFVGGTNGINSFYPEKINTSSLQPKTTITNFYLFNKEVQVGQKINNRILLNKSIFSTDSIQLKPGQNDFRFDFSALIYSNPNKIEYAYMLEGYDKDWNYTSSKQRSAIYTNISHGEYIFKVKSTNDDGLWETTPVNVFIHIKTPFVYTRFAVLVYIAGIILIFIYFTNFSVIRITTKKRIILENEHNQKLHDLDLMRTRFFINISHDLRTPLTLINGPIENILKNKNLNPDIKTQLELAYRNVKKLKYLVEQLLDVRKAESGKLKVRPITQNIISFVQSEASHFEYVFKSKGIILNIMSEDNDLIVSFDPSMLSKVIFNLLSNSIKYTKKGEINIRICKISKDKTALLKNAGFDNYIKIEIQDTGDGIKEEMLSRIFVRFYPNEMDLGKGYGIGLSHCKDLIEAHSGVIEVKSVLGSGTSVIFYIPNIITSDYVDDEENTGIETNSELIASDLKVINRNQLQESDIKNSVLIVEDNADMRRYLSSELLLEFKIYEAVNGLEGKEKALDLLPDLIISDVMMPEMDGVELCKAIKTNIKTSHIPVILLTARVDTETKYKGIEIGADDYISKPFEMELLILRIKNLLKTREHLRNLFQKNNVLEPSAITVTSLDEKFLTELMDALEKGISDTDFTVNSLESAMGMSHTNFYRKIKSITGVSGKEILQNMRMKRAQQLFRDNKDLRVSEVAFMVGFNNPTYFSRCYKETFGITPRDIGKSDSQ